MDWLSDHWQSIGGTILALIGAAYIPFVRMFIVKGIKALLSEAFLKELFLSLAEKYVRSTKTKLDDAWFDQMKKSL